MNVHRTAYLQTIRQRLRDNPIVSLVGPRQAGKTTLARMFAEETTEASAGAVHFFDLESPSDLARLTNPELVLGPLAAVFKIVVASKGESSCGFGGFCLLEF